MPRLLLSIDATVYLSLFGEMAKWFECLQIRLRHKIPLLNKNVRRDVGSEKNLSLALKPVSLKVCKKNN